MGNLARTLARGRGRARARKLAAGLGGAAVVPAVLTAFSLVTDAVQTAGFVGGNQSTYIRNGIEYQGAVSVLDGIHYVIGVDIATGTIVSKTAMNSDYTAFKDDHNASCPWLMPDGVTVVYLDNAHNFEAKVKARRSTTGDPADAGASADIVTPGLVTYPTPLDHPGNGDAFFAHRGSENDWYLTRTQNNGSTWQVFSNPVWHDTDQCYCRFQKIGANEYFVQASRNSNNDATIYCFRVNTSTGAIRNAAGTTVANFLTGSPAASATSAFGSADIFYTPPAGFSAGIGNWFADGTARFFYHADKDDQFNELWWSRCTDLANIANPANWVHTKIMDLGYCVGSATATANVSQWSSKGNVVEALYPGVTKKRLVVGQLLGGMNYTSIIELQADNTWKNVLAFNQASYGSGGDHSEYPKWVLGASDSSKKLIASLSVQDHADFDSITNATMKFLRIDSVGVNAPVITVGSTFAVDEYSDYMLTLTADQPCGFNIVGGADAANFEIIGGKYLRLIHAANYDAPHDANADNAFVVQVSARGFGVDLESAAFTITLSINPLVKTGGSQLFLQTADLSHASWTASGLGTRVNNSTDVLDPAGGNTMDKLPQSATTTSHNVSQTRTVPAGVQHTDHYVWHPDAEAHYLSLRRTFGAAGNIVPTFDGVRGRLVNTGISVVPDSTFCIPLANGCWHVGMTYTAPVGSASGSGGPAVRQFAGPSSTEFGIVAAAAYIKDPTHMTGKYKTHVARLT